MLILNLQTVQCLYLVVGLNLQEKRRDHTDSFLSADVTLQGQKSKKKCCCYFKSVMNERFVSQLYIQGTLINSKANSKSVILLK